jgi:hypothetical protein
MAIGKEESDANGKWSSSKLEVTPKNTEYAPISSEKGQKSIDSKASEHECSR